MLFFSFPGSTSFVGQKSEVSGIREEGRRGAWLDWSRPEGKERKEGGRSQVKLGRRKKKKKGEGEKGSLLEFDWLLLENGGSLSRRAEDVARCRAGKTTNDRERESRRRLEGGKLGRRLSSSPSSFFLLLHSSLEIQIRKEERRVACLLSCLLLLPLPWRVGVVTPKTRNLLFFSLSFFRRGNKLL